MSTGMSSIFHCVGSGSVRVQEAWWGLWMGKSTLPTPSPSPQHPCEDGTCERNALSPPRSPAARAHKGSLLRPPFPPALTRTRTRHENERGQSPLAWGAWKGTPPFPPFCASFSSTHARTESVNGTDAGRVLRGRDKSWGGRQ